MSPRKSSTSSGRPRRPRFRYLGLEVAAEPLPLPSSFSWEARLREALDRTTSARIGFRLVRQESRRAIVRIDRADLAESRRAWNGDLGSTPTLRVRTVRTWGTLVGAKRWWRGRGPPATPSSEPS